jgi:hypothetical protein
MDSPPGMKVRAAIGINVIVAFFAALTLASSPQLHERLHRVDSQHECAATLIASGNVHYAAPPPLLPAKLSAPEISFVLFRDSELIRIAVPSSILEHAPPALI